MILNEDPNRNNHPLVPDCDASVRLALIVRIKGAYHFVPQQSQRGANIVPSYRLVRHNAVCCARDNAHALRSNLV